MMEGTDDEPLGRPSFQQHSAECECNRSIDPEGFISYKEYVGQAVGDEDDEDIGLLAQIFI